MKKMGLFKKKEEFQPIPCENNEILAPADGKLIDVSEVDDDMFAQKMLGESIAFVYDGDTVTISSPANGILTALFPTGHAFGIEMEGGAELLIHIGIDTVSANGQGFRLLSKKQGDSVRAGEPIVQVNLKELRREYDMSTMLIVTNDNGHRISFEEPQAVLRGQVIGRLEH